MKRNWLKNKEYITELNVLGGRHRTNICEKRHSQINKYINKNYVTINKLLTVLSVELKIYEEKTPRKKNTF